MEVEVAEVPGRAGVVEAVVVVGCDWVLGDGRHDPTSIKPTRPLSRRVATLNQSEGPWCRLFTRSR